VIACVHGVHLDLRCAACDHDQALIDAERNGTEPPALDAPRRHGLTDAQRQELANAAAQVLTEVSGPHEAALHAVHVRFLAREAYGWPADGLCVPGLIVEITERVAAWRAALDAYADAGTLTGSSADRERIWQTRRGVRP
jgi:hypothetical protein